MNTFAVQKKILSIHTEDRDISKWPTSTVFTIDTPIEYKSVVSLRLADIDLPINMYVFSEKNQNISMSVITDKPYTITISEGTYTGPQLATELQGRINDTLNSTNYNVKYDSSSMKFVFYTIETFKLDFTNPLDSTIYAQSSQWGLGSYLGFEKKMYTSSLNNVNYQIGTTISTLQSILSPFPASIQGDPYIYMDLDLYNNMDEIIPYTIRSNNLISANYGGKHNSSFAKIPRITFSGNPVYVSKENFLTNLFFSDPPLERVQSFKFKFRYHDGRLVDFGLTNFSFSIEITMLRYIFD